MKSDGTFLRIQTIALSILLYWAALSLAQEGPTILAGHGTLSGSILPLWVGAEAKLFEKHAVQVKPIYLPRAAGRPTSLSRSSTTIDLSSRSSPKGAKPDLSRRYS